MNQEDDAIVSLIKNHRYKEAEGEILRITHKLLSRLEEGIITQSDIYNRLQPIYDHIWPLSMDIEFSGWVWDIFLELDVFKTYNKMNTSFMKETVSKASSIKG
jgi:hypothetical protein